MNKNTSTEYVQIDTRGQSPITGKMITASFTENSGFFRDEDIKKELIDLLVEEIIQERCIEFTKQIDPDSMSTFFRARIFVTPDTQTRYIRQWMKK